MLQRRPQPNPRIQFQLELANRIIAEQLNVRQVEDLARDWKSSEKPPRKKADAPPPEADANVKAAEKSLQEHFATRVAILQQENGKGKIEIQFENMDDLIRIYDLILGDKA